MSPAIDEEGELLATSLRAAVLFVLALALLLFLPAWSLRFWQGWVYWALFSAFVVLGSLYFARRDPALVRRRMNAGPAAEHEPSQKVIQTIVSVLMIALFVVPGFDHRLHWSSVPTALVWAGDAVMMAGWLSVVPVLRENSWAASTVQVEQGQPVIATGPYAWVRHPMYAGSMVALLATPLALGSWWALLPAVLLCAMIVVRLLAEERYLTAHLAGYAEYRRKVRHRLIPLVW